MTPITRWTIWQRRWSLIWWCLGIAALIIFTMAFYPTIRDQSAELQKSFSKLSNGTVALFSDTREIFSPVGYLSSQIFYLTLPLLLGVLAIAMGSSLIAKEEDSSTIELLLARPVSRGRLLLGKSLAALAILAAVSGVALICLSASVKLVHVAVPLPAVAAATLASASLALLLGSVAFAVASLGRTGRAACLGIAALVAVGGYLLSSLSAAVSWLRWPSVISPFHYYHPAEILGGNYHWTETIGFLAAALILGVLSWLAFRKRDIVS